jgi:hypothetical protein
MRRALHKENQQVWLYVDWSKKTELLFAKLSEGKKAVYFTDYEATLLQPRARLVRKTFPSILVVKSHSLWPITVPYV